MYKCYRTCRQVRFGIATCLKQENALFLFLEGILESKNISFDVCPWKKGSIHKFRNWWKKAFV